MRTNRTTFQCKKGTCDAGPAPRGPRGLGVSWFAQAQQHLSDASLHAEAKFIGNLYKEMEKLAEEKAEGMRHPDCDLCT